MKKALAVFGLLFGLVSYSHAGTPQEAFYQGQAPLSGSTIVQSSATTVGTAPITLTISTPTVINSGGGTYTGRICITRFVLQVATYTVVTIADNNTTDWTINGAGLGTTGTNTLSIAEDHLGPFCIAAGDRMVITATPTAGQAANPETINVEGYTTYGGTLNSGPMY